MKVESFIFIQHWVPGVRVRSSTQISTRNIRNHYNFCKKIMSNPRISLSILLLLILATATNLFSQSLPDSTVKKIDILFKKWNNINTPGCAIGIVRNDSLVFSKGYGIANLEYNLPITTKTIFYTASVSKQFTGYCIVLLARQGKLKLDDDIHIYLPWMPDFGKRITIRNLLNHTSGIRDDLELAAISGLGIDGVLTQELALNILKKQHILIFSPGERYSYSNSNYILLAEIVRSVSRKSFRAFADSAIFKPLKMHNSHFHDDYSELVKERAVSYWAINNNRYKNAFQNVY